MTKYRYTTNLSQGTETEFAEDSPVAGIPLLGTTVRVGVVETMGKVGTAGSKAEPELGGAEGGVAELFDLWGIAGEIRTSPRHQSGNHS